MYFGFDIDNIKRYYLYRVHLFNHLNYLFLFKWHNNILDGYFI